MTNTCAASFWIPDVTSVERRRKIQFAKALAAVLSDTVLGGKERLPAAARTPTRGDPFATSLRRLCPTASLALAAAALSAVIGSSWLVIEGLRLRAQLAQLQTEQQSRRRGRQALEGQSADERARSDTLSSRLQSKRQQRERREELIRELERGRAAPTTKPIQPTILSMVLQPGTTRSGSSRPKVVLPPSARVVRLQIGIAVFFHPPTKQEAA